MISRNRVPVKVQKRSAFNKSHFNLFTSQVGVLTPVLVDEYMGNTVAHLRINLAASMPPLAADTFMKTDVAIEAFFVPHRLCYGGFESFYCQQARSVIDLDGKPADFIAALPIVQVAYGDDGNLGPYFGHRGLADFMGYRSSAYHESIFNINPLPFVAYHLIWQHYYRQPLVQKECFARVDGYEGYVPAVGKYSLATLPYVSLDAAHCIIDTQSGDGVNFFLADDVNLFQLRKRNFGYDYFTNAFPEPSLNGDMDVEVVNGKFSIASLRASNSMQMMKEKMQLAGGRYQDELKVKTGDTISDGIATRPVLLGAAKYSCYNKQLSVNAVNELDDQGDLSNPFVGFAGGIQGNMYASGTDLLIDNFHAKEPGYLIVIASLVPTVTYSTGCSRLLTRYRDPNAQIVDLADPSLVNTGNEPIYQYELTGRIGTSDANAPVFGYSDRFASWCSMPDEIHGLFRTGLALQAFVSQRYFGPNGSPSINSAFLQIPTTYLDDVMVAGINWSSYGYWCEIGFEYHVSQPLPEYSLPSLMDPAYEHGDTVTVHRGGFHF